MRHLNACCFFLSCVFLLLVGETPVSAWQELQAPTPESLVQAGEAHYAIPASDENLPGNGPVRRYDWFEKLWQQRRWKWANEAQQDQGALVFLGDSITQGWGDDMGNAFATPVANRGISGDTTRGMLVRLDEDVLALHPKGVVLLAGTNDLEEKASVEQIAGNMKEILTRLHAFDPELPIVLCLVFPSSAQKSRPADAIRKINQAYREVVAGRDYVTVVDTWTLFANSEGDAQVEEFPDLLHPNQDGYQKWAAALRPFLEKLNLVSVNMEKTLPVEQGFQSLFNGKDLSGWSYQPSSEEDRKAATGWKNADPNAPAWPLLDESISHQGKKVTNDGRYLANHGRLIVCYPPEGRKIQQLWTEETFGGDLTLRLQFRASPNADSGVFVCGKQLQCRDYLRAALWGQDPDAMSCS